MHAAAVHEHLGKPCQLHAGVSACRPSAEFDVATTPDGSARVVLASADAAAGSSLYDGVTAAFVAQLAARDAAARIQSCAPGDVHVTRP